MRRRLLAGGLLALVAMLALSATAAAGGWATVEMEKPVTRTEVDEPLTLDFTLLQHGVTPTDWTKTYFEATNADTGETMRVDAKAGAEVGQWTVLVSFPSAGNWDWAIKTDELAIEDTFPAIEVVGDVTVAGSSGGVTPAQLDAAIADATEPLTKQISSLGVEMDGLQKEVTNLTVERDTLQKQIANLEAAQAEQPEATGTAWWVSALAGAAAALAVVGGGALFAMRRGLIRTRELSPATG